MTFADMERQVSDLLLECDVADWPTYRSVDVPGYGPFPLTVLIEGCLSDGRSSGLCASIDEAQERVRALYCGRVQTQSPRGQASRKEMLVAWASLQAGLLRDGGQCAAAVGGALEAGLGTVAWAQASRYLVAGWVPCAPASDQR